MYIVHVDIVVKPESVESFMAATLINAQASRKEPGIAQFDLLRRRDDPARFLLIEAYRDEQAPLRHKETPHYRVWADTVAPMMAQPRSSLKYEGIESSG